MYRSASDMPFTLLLYNSFPLNPTASVVNLSYIVYISARVNKRGKIFIRFRLILITKIAKVNCGLKNLQIELISRNSNHYTRSRRIICNVSYSYVSRNRYPAYVTFLPFVHAIKAVTSARSVNLMMR